MLNAKKEKCCIKGKNEKKGIKCKILMMMMMMMMMTEN